MKRALSPATLLAWVCHYSGVSALFFLLNRRRKRILTYHNVLPDADFTGALHESVSHRLSVFEAHVRYLRRFACDTNLEDPSTLTITFDDGYANQEEYGARVLTRAGLRAYFFIPVSLLEHNEALAVDRMLFWLSAIAPGKYEITMPGADGTMPIVIATAPDRLAAWQALSRYLEQHPTRDQDLVAALDACVPFEQLKGTISNEYHRLRFAPLTMEGVKRLADGGHLIGPHSQSHRPLSALTPADLNAELEACASATWFNSRVLSYPFGTLEEVSPEVVAGAASHGFTHAVSNINQPLSGPLRYGRHFLPRLALPDSDRTWKLSFVLSGAKYFLQHRRLLPAC